MFCKNCGKQLPDGALFCDGCGQKLAEDATQKSVEKSNRKLLIILIGIAIAFLIAAIVFGVLILKKIGDDDEDEDVTSPLTEMVSPTPTYAETPTPTEAVTTEPKEEATPTPTETAEPGNQTGKKDELAQYFAERFPNLVAGYANPKSEKSIWIPIDEATRAKLDALDNDYNKVAWVVEYAFRALPSVVVSFSIHENCGVTYTFVAFTNVGDKAVSIDGTADIYTFDNVKKTSGYPYIGMLQPGGTYICPIACPGMDENNIDVGYSALSLDYSAAKPGTYSVTASLGAHTNSNITTSISVKNTSDRKVSMGQVTVLLLDENGFPVANGYVFGATGVNAGDSMNSDVQIGILEEDIERVKDIAVFASPFITG